MKGNGKGTDLLAGLALGLTVFAGSALAGVYKWTDANGVVHYGDQPRQGASAVKNLPANRPAPARTPAASPPPATTGSSDAAATLSARESEIRGEECERAQTRLTSYREADRLVVTGEDGSQQEMSADERVAALARVEQHVAALCNAP